MNVQTRSSSKHITFAAHAPHAISGFCGERCAQHADLGACADRVEERRGSRRRCRIDHAEALLRRRLAQQQPAQGPGGPCRAPPLYRLPPLCQSGARLTLARLLRFDRGLDGGMATVCAHAAVQTAVATEHHSAVSACPGPDRRSRDASMREKFPSEPLPQDTGPWLQHVMDVGAGDAVHKSATVASHAKVILPAGVSTPPG